VLLGYKIESRACWDRIIEPAQSMAARLRNNNLNHIVAPIAAWPSWLMGQASLPARPKGP